MSGLRSFLLYLLRILPFIAFCQLAGLIGSFFTAPNIPTWYASLEKPFFNPPNWVFAPVWTALYAMMGVSLFLVWRRRGESEHASKAMAVFMAQLFLNTLWSIVFFGSKSILGGLAVIVLLGAFIVWTIRLFNKVSKAAGKLLVPYLLWVVFATILNLSIFFLNI
ncbi:MAG: tryptophan-rich sensory protein [Candidatus Altiarchaeales archaeon]|nr:tryptophan-rich sensory protein [Candidatus Altiarchaeales archaeon]MBD3417000.1 tryptophan-rich sensory protein [Candidatus Altiarchaeales archaeon]